MTELKIIYKDINDLIPYVNNARTHNDKQVTQIASSIKEFGFNNPILLDGANGVIAGHGRLLAAQKLKLDKVPCVELGHLSEQQKKAYILADNKIALNSDWDSDLLKLELEALNIDDFDFNAIGFNDDEISDLLQENEEDVQDIEDGDISPKPNPVSKKGDLWTLGAHKLLCGDSTSEECLKRLLGGG